MVCAWCGMAFAQRGTGGKPQKFCSTRCRREMDAGLRAWAQDQLAAGRVTIAELQRARCPGPPPAMSPMSMRRLTRLTNAFGKKLDNLKAAVALHFAHYNLCRIHGGLRVTPAMAASIATSVWEIERLLPN